MESSVFWDIMLCSPPKVYQCFWGTCRLHLQGRKISQARNQSESRPSDVGWLSTHYAALYPRRQPSMTAAVRTSNPTRNMATQQGSEMLAYKNKCGLTHTWSTGAPCRWCTTQEEADGQEETAWPLGHSETGHPLFSGRNSPSLLPLQHCQHTVTVM
jgi:hypothetical protein